MAVRRPLEPGRPESGLVKPDCGSPRPLESGRPRAALEAVAAHVRPQTTLATSGPTSCTPMFAITLATLTPGITLATMTLGTPPPDTPPLDTATLDTTTITETAAGYDRPILAVKAAASPPSPQPKQWNVPCSGRTRNPERQNGHDPAVDQIHAGHSTVCPVGCGPDDRPAQHLW
jgi:hypothetical protein